MANRKTRGQGEGSIYWVEGRQRWAAQTPHDPITGKRKYIYGKTKKEVQTKLNAALSDQHKGIPVAVERQTLAEFLDRWLNQTARHRLATSTFERYGGNIRLHIAPALGGVLLSKLTPQHLQGLYDRLIKKGLSTRSVQYCHAILHTALEEAADWDLIGRNPADRVKSPRPNPPEVRVLSPDEIRRFLAAAAGERYGTLYAVALASGLRQGELLGLKWADVDWSADTLQIRRKLSRTRAHGLAFGDLKSKKGRRSLPLPAPVMEELRRHREAQREERARRGDAWVDHDLLFPNEVGKPVEAQNLVRRSYKPLLKRAGLPDIRFHDLRHSSATLLLSMGVPMKVIQERLGHANMKMTADLYAHAGESMQRDAADKLAKFLDDRDDEGSGRLEERAA